MQAESGRLVPDQSALAVRDLNVSYRGRRALERVSLKLRAGRLVGVVGPNGAGKSTLLKACLGLVPIESGEVEFFGRTLAEARPLIGYVPQRESVDWDFPVRAIDVAAMGTYGRLGLFRRVGRGERAEAMEALEAVGLADLAARQIGQLSGGQQQRVFLARALAQRARIYLMDEPLASVDAVTEERVVAVLRRLREDGCTSVVVHHDLESARRFFDDVVVLNRTLVSAGPVEEAMHPRHLKLAYGAVAGLPR